MEILTITEFRQLAVGSVWDKEQHHKVTNRYTRDELSYNPESEVMEKLTTPYAEGYVSIISTLQGKNLKIIRTEAFDRNDIEPEVLTIIPNKAPEALRIEGARVLGSNGEDIELHEIEKILPYHFSSVDVSLLFAD